jgi:hypothetical protein
MGNKITQNAASIQRLFTFSVAEKPFSNALARKILRK